MQVQMHLCAGQHTNVVELRALCQHDTALYMVMVSSMLSCVWSSFTVCILGKLRIHATVSPAWRLSSAQRAVSL